MDSEPRHIGTNDKSKPTVFLGMPHYSGQVDIHAARALFQDATLGGANIWTPDAGGSLLAHTFNQLYFAGLVAYDEGHITHVGLLHADIWPEPGFVDILLREMEANDADIISAVVPLKDSSGLTSTAVGDPADEWRGTPLHMDEICKLPPTFSIKDTPWDGMELLINSGLMLIDLRKPWVHEMDEQGNLKAFFTINDRVQRNPDGTYTRFVESEDWFFSRRVHRLGGKVCATRAVHLRHIGTHLFATPTLAEVEQYQASLQAPNEIALANADVVDLANRILAVRKRNQDDYERIKCFVGEVEQAA